MREKHKEQMMDLKCEQCNRKLKADEPPLIECPACGVDCCEDCIAGKRVDCFQCENAHLEDDED